MEEVCFNQSVGNPGKVPKKNNVSLDDILQLEESQINSDRYLANTVIDKQMYEHSVLVKLKNNSLSDPSFKLTTNHILQFTQKKLELIFPPWEENRGIINFFDKLKERIYELLLEIKAEKYLKKPMRRELFEKLYKPCFTKINSLSSDCPAYTLRFWYNLVITKTPTYINGLDFTEKTISKKYVNKCNCFNKYEIMCYIDSIYIAYNGICPRVKVKKINIFDHNSCYKQFLDDSDSNYDSDSDSIDA